MKLTWLSLAFGMSSTLLSGVAQAAISDCGNIDVEAEAQCELDVSGGCEVNCTPLHFEAACQARVESECEFGGCKVDIDIGTCQVECQAECQGHCEVNPPEFDCAAECQGECGVDCDAHCAASAEAECEASSEEGRAACEAKASASCSGECTAQCDGKCEASCTGTPPSAECDGKCEAACQGECNVKVDAECKLECQTELRGECQAELQGSCEAECEAPEGALFCDGQYVDHGDHLDKCIKSLNAYLEAHVKTEGSSYAECGGNKCEAEAEGKVEASCSMTSLPKSGGALGLAFGAGLAALAIARRRRSH